MRSAEERLQVFCRWRGRVALESVLAALGAALLATIAPAAEHSAPDAQVLYLAVAALFSVRVVGLVGRVVPLLLFRCPRCRERFHGELLRALRVLPTLPRACRGCGLTPEMRLRPQDTPEADASGH